jgi:hypothetical protein
VDDPRAARAGAGVEPGDALVPGVGDEQAESRAIPRELSSLPVSAT